MSDIDTKLLLQIVAEFQKKNPKKQIPWKTEVVPTYIKRAHRPTSDNTLGFRTRLSKWYHNHKNEIGRAAYAKKLLFDAQTVEEYDSAIATGANVDMLKNGENVFITACRKGRTELIGHILDAHPDLLNSQDGFGDTGMAWSAYKAYIKIVKKLLEYPHLDVNIKNNDNNTAFTQCLLNHYVGAEIASLSSMGTILASRLLLTDERTKGHVTLDQFRRCNPDQLYMKDIGEYTTISSITYGWGIPSILHVSADDHSLEYAVMDTNQNPTKRHTIVLEEGEYYIYCPQTGYEEGGVISIDSPVKIIGAPGTSKTKIIVRGGFHIEENVQGMVDIENITITSVDGGPSDVPSDDDGIGVFGQSSFNLTNVLIEKCNSHGVNASGSSTVATCTNVEVRYCKGSGIAASSGATITLIGSDTKIDHNQCLDCHDYQTGRYSQNGINRHYVDEQVREELSVDASSTVQLVSPLTIGRDKSVYKDDGEGADNDRIITVDDWAKGRLSAAKTLDDYTTAFKYLNPGVNTQGPISLDSPIVIPVRCRDCRRLFEARELHRHLQNRDNCPMCRKPMNTLEFLTDFQIRRWNRMEATTVTEESKIADKRKEIGDKRKEIGDKRKEITGKRKEIATEESKIADKRKEIADKRKEIATEESKIGDKRKEIATANVVIKENALINRFRQFVVKKF